MIMVMERFFLPENSQMQVSHWWTNSIGSFVDNSRSTTISNPELSVIICTYNRARLLGDCLKSLLKQTLSHDRYEILVIDNNSSDATASLVISYVGAHPHLRYLFEADQGLSFARNRGCRESRGIYVAYIDDDATASSQWCEGILRCFAEVTPTPVAVGGPILPRLCCNPPFWYTPALETRSWGETSHFLDDFTGTFGFSGSNMAFKKDVLLHYNGFDTTLGMRGDRVGMGEESDLFFRIGKEAPFFWYDPQLKVYHLVAPSQLAISSRIHRTFLAGRSRRKIEQERELTFLWELASIFFVTRDFFFRRPFDARHAIISFIDRISNRMGYLTGRKG
jgi:glycosyltransferase involved in cell wall biosynthesis